MAFYQHFLHDTYKLTEKMEIDWEVNKSWREARQPLANVNTAAHNLSLAGSTAFRIVTDGTIQ